MYTLLTLSLAGASVVKLIETHVRRRHRLPSVTQVLVFNEIDTVKLAMAINHVVAFEVLDLPRLFELLELRYFLLQLIVVDVLSVPVRNLVKLE